MTLGEIIKSYRQEHQMSMDAFSSKSGISKAYISLLEKNKHPKTGKAIAPSIQCIKQAADGMGMDFNNLFKLIDGDVSLQEDTPVKEEPPSTPDSLTVTGLEKDIIIEYRRSDDITQAMVLRALSLEETEEQENFYAG